MNATRLSSAFVTLGPIGHLVAPGTMATLLTIPAVYWVRTYVVEHSLLYGFFVIMLLIIALFAVTYTLQQLRRFDDPSEIVIDEVIGCFITFWGVPLSAQSIIIGFLLFRFFDIFKIGGVRYAERFTDAWGILLDDIIAGILSNMLLRLLVM